MSSIGGKRYLEILELGLANYQNSVELNFWKMYFPHIVYSKEFSKEDCKQLIDKYGDDESLVPYFYLYLFDKEKYTKEKKHSDFFLIFIRKNQLKVTSFWPDLHDNVKL